MIAFLQGAPQILEDSVIVLVNGVGYKVEVGQRTLASLNKTEVKLFIHTHVREDRIQLFGFIQTQQLKLFQLMIDVSGVGPKTALEITDRNPEQIIEAVQNAQVNFFKSIPRIGKKTAQKIILELKPKLGSLKELSLGPRSPMEQDVYEALSALGYEETDISQVLSELDLEELSVEDAVKKVLQNL